MATIVFGMNQSLDGYVDHDHPAFVMGPDLFQHYVERIGALSGSVYGRRMYGLMRYWDDDQDGWDAPRRAFAAAWRRQPKWVVSETLSEVGPNATLVRGGPEALVRRLKAEENGEIEVAGPVLAGSLTALGLIDVYRIYLHPVVIGRGNPFFAGPRPRLRLVASERYGDVIQLEYVPG